MATLQGSAVHDFRVCSRTCGDESAPHCVLDLEGNEGISDELFRRVDMARGVEAFFRTGS